jgi:hypothetical protein
MIRSLAGGGVNGNETRDEDTGVELLLLITNQNEFMISNIE